MSGRTSMTNPARERSRRIRLAVMALCCGPALILGVDWWRQALGPNPLDRLVKDTGLWAFVFLLLALSITPARRLAVWLCTLAGMSFGRRLADWNVLVQFRRPLGLACFGYALLHAWCYWWFDAGAEPGALRRDLDEKPFMVVGMVALLLLAPLALTSTDGAVRRLGPRWKQLHRLAHPIAILALLHVGWGSKPGLMLPWMLGGAVAAVLAYHLLTTLGLIRHHPQDDGMEVAPRTRRWARQPRRPGGAVPSEAKGHAAPPHPRTGPDRDTAGRQGELP